MTFELQKQIESLVRRIHDRIPSATIETAPLASGGAIIDLRIDGQSFVIDFRPDVGFGLSSLTGEPLEDFGSGSDEFYPQEDALLQRVIELLESGRRTEPQRAALLQELRDFVGISQVEVARRLGIRQPSVSKIERSSRITLDTLRSYVEALGADLRLVVDLNGQKFELQLGKEDESATDDSVPPPRRMVG